MRQEGLHQVSNPSELPLTQDHEVSNWLIRKVKEAFRELFG